MRLLIKTKMATALLLIVPCFNAFAALQGTLEVVDCTTVRGWAWNSATPATRVKVDIYDVVGTQNKLLATVTAQLLRNDLLAAGKGDGKYGFSYLLPASIRNAVTHKFSVRFNGTTTVLTGSPKITAAACYGKLNDTGLLTCSDATTNGLTCPVVDFLGQDANYGRDTLARVGRLVKIGAGSAGFDFTKIANNGAVLSAGAALGTLATNWACTRDNVTGLIWEVKTNNGGLRDKDNTYSWYDSVTTTNGGLAGSKNFGVCTGGISCDTESYIKAVNALRLCGKSNWRVPKKSELLSIIDRSRVLPVVNSTYFPNTLKPTGDDFVWSSLTYAGANSTAWIVDMKYGNSAYDYKNNDNAVRLVSGG